MTGFHRLANHGWVAIGILTRGDLVIVTDPATGAPALATVGWASRPDDVDGWERIADDRFILYVTIVGIHQAEGEDEIRGQCPTTDREVKLAFSAARAAVALVDRRGLSTG